MKRRHNPWVHIQDPIVGTTVWIRESPALHTHKAGLNVHALREIYPTT